MIVHSIVRPESAVVLREGDFPAFYAASIIMKEGQAAHLYEKEWQNQIEQKYWTGGFLYFRYPPSWATLLTSLAYFDPLSAKWIFTFFMVLCLLSAFILASTYAPVLKINWLATSALMITCSPMMSALLCGQNSTLNMLLYAVILYGLHRHSKIGFYLCGAAAGLMLYKPQFGLIWGVWFLLSQQKKFISSFLTIGILLYLMGATTHGFFWPSVWLKQTLWAVRPIWDLDSHAMISFNGVAYALSGTLPASAHLSREIILKTSYFLSMVLFLWIGFQFWKTRKIVDENKRHAQLFSLALLAGPASLLISAHTMYYEFGICLLPCAVFFNPNNRVHVRGLLILMLLMDTSLIFRTQLIIQPAFFATLLCIGFISFYNPINKNG